LITRLPQEDHRERNGETEKLKDSISIQSQEVSHHCSKIRYYWHSIYSISEYIQQPRAEAPSPQLAGEAQRRRSNISM
jgi:hypothetical protein